MRILVTGSRDWDDAAGIADALWGHYANDVPTVVHGGCRGADIIARDLADGYGWETEEHLADWRAHGRAAGPIRNQAMVDLGADVCLAFPLGASRGTRDCMRRAAAAGIPVVTLGEDE